MPMRLTLLSLISIVIIQPAWGQNWKAGVAKEKITPEKPIWMTGYGSRTHVSTGVIQDLYVKALALDDGSGRPAVLVTTDILGFPAQVSANIAEAAQKQFDLPRDRLVLNSSHTHCGPALAHPHRMLYIRATPEELRDTDEYTRQLEAKVVATIGQAIKNFRPATVRFGHSDATFGINRRVKTDKGYVISVNPKGPVDHDVPFLAIEGEQNQLVAIVFGYACHNTTLGGDIYEFNGDYAGFAQAQLEKQHPQAVAMFVQGCGADANPNPRGKVEQAKEYGQSLAAAVEKAMGGSLASIGGPLKSSYQVFPVDFAPPPARDAWEVLAKSKDIYRRWQAQELLKVMDRDGKLPATYPYPLQVWQFGKDLTFIAMGGEVVVDYDLRFKKEFGADRLWVAGYSNDVFAYIPSRRVLEEGGYEAADAMIYYVQPGPFAPSIEETIVQHAHAMVKSLQATH